MPPKRNNDHPQGRFRPDYQATALLEALGRDKLALGVKTCRRWHNSMNPFPCRKRFLCDRCAWVHAKKIGSEVAASMALARRANPSLNFYFLTLTVPASLDPVAQAKDLRRLLTSLRRSLGAWLVVTGINWIIDVAKSHSGLWWLHIHAILAVDPSKIPEANLRARTKWTRKTGRPCPHYFPEWFPELLIAAWARRVAKLAYSRLRDEDPTKYARLMDPLAYSKFVGIIRDQQDISILRAHGLDDVDLDATTINEERVVDDAFDCADYAWAMNRKETANHKKALSAKDRVTLTFAGLGRLRGRAGVLGFPQAEIEAEAKVIRNRHEAEQELEQKRAKRTKVKKRPVRKEPTRRNWTRRVDRDS